MRASVTLGKAMRQRNGRDARTTAQSCQYIVLAYGLYNAAVSFSTNISFALVVSRSVSAGAMHYAEVQASASAYLADIWCNAHTTIVAVLCTERYSAVNA